MGRRPQRLWWIACAIAASVALGLAPARADADSEADLATLTNGTRAEAAVDALVRNPDLDEIAQRHSVRMAERGGEPWHNPELAAEARNWTELGEIVGAVDSNNEWQARVHEAFVRSHRHREEIVHSKYQELGVGVAYNGTEKRYYVTEIFRLPTEAESGPGAAKTASELRPSSAVAAVAPAPPPKPLVGADVPRSEATASTADAPITAASAFLPSPVTEQPRSEPTAQPTAPTAQPTAPDPLTAELASTQALAPRATGPSPALLGVIPIALAALPVSRRLRRHSLVTAPALASIAPAAPVVCAVSAEPPPLRRRGPERPILTKPFLLDADGATECDRLRSQLRLAWAVIDDTPDLRNRRREPIRPAAVDETSPFVHGRDRSSP